MRKGDRLIFVVLLIVGAIMLYNHYFQEKTPGNIAVVTIDGEIVERFDLSKNLPDYLVETENGYNLLSFADGMVRVIEADCPDQICIHFGWIKNVGQTIVCLPHKMVVRIENEAIKDDLDGVAY